jgi:hypothetical protein
VKEASTQTWLALLETWQALKTEQHVAFLQVLVDEQLFKSSWLGFVFVFPSDFQVLS